MTTSRKSRLTDAVWALVVLVLAGAIGFALASILSLRQFATESADERDQLASDVEVLRDQLADLGQEPAVGPPGQSGDRGPAGERGERGRRGRAPTEREISLAVEGYFATNPPEPGRAPTSEEIAAAVAGYCADVGGCRGADGNDGAPGPGASNEQVAAEVAAYCDARDQCRGVRGERGQTGSTGATGPAGRGVRSIDCNPVTGEFVITYTDGETQQVNGSVCTTNVIGPIPIP